MEDLILFLHIWSNSVVWLRNVQLVSFVHSIKVSPVQRLVAKVEFCMCVAAILKKYKFYPKGDKS